MHYIGLMSGTSVDGVDAALVSIPVNGQLALLAAHQHPFPAAVRDAIQALMLPGPNEIEREGELDVQLGRLFAEATHALLAKSGVGASRIRAIGSHGQTIRHRPHAAHPFTRQIGNPSVIAEETGITTVADFRARDLAAGGEGAPLAPAFHHWLFRKSGINRAIVNIGGIANITWLPATGNSAVLGFDTGPGNTLLDQWIARHRNESYDRDGAWAGSGRAHERLLAQLMADEYFSKAPPKSTGREHFNLAWLEQRLADKPAPEDVQATLAELTAASIVRGTNFLPDKIAEIYVCGGGSHNRHLLARLRALLPNIPVATTETLGLDPDWVEAAAFAWLAHQTLAGHSGNLPSVTGARHPVLLGGIYLA
jgi:anhydro-N-acetylmuramic acid kinase